MNIWRRHKQQWPGFLLLSCIYCGIADSLTYSNLASSGNFVKFKVPHNWLYIDILMAIKKILDSCDDSAGQIMN